VWAAFRRACFCSWVRRGLSCWLGGGFVVCAEFGVAEVIIKICLAFVELVAVLWESDWVFDLVCFR